MTTFEKKWFRFNIIKSDKIYTWDFEKDYFSLTWEQVSRLANYAEIFKIKADAKGRSASRVLWYQLQSCIDYLKKQELPF